MSEEQLECARCGDAVKSVVASEIKCWRTNSHQGICVMCEADEKRFASQVCEQREKSCCGDAHGEYAALSSFVESLGLVKERNGNTEIWRNARAAAAELALQKYRDDFQNREAAVCPEDVGFEEFIASLKTALQAKEQAVAKLFKEVSLLNGQLAQAEARDLARESELAQARQQAVADLIPQLEKRRQDAIARADKWENAKEGDKANYWLGAAYGQGSAIYLLKSLTPPPALTKEK